MRAWRRRSSWRAARWGRRSPLSRGSPPTSRSTATSANGPRRPSLILGAADQVAGPAKPSSTADLAAKVWIAIDADGVAIAGEVTDDKVLFGTAQTMVNADHLELWLAFPAASLPLLGFANQFGETEVHGESDCNGEINHPDACKQWFAKQTRRRATLGRIFVRQYLLGGTGLSEAWASMLAGKHAADPVRACCAWSSGLVKKVPGGWRFEARIGLADLPESAQIPLKDVKLMVDLVDANVGSDKLETFRSSSPTRKFGEPDTFNLVTLAKPLAWESRRGPGDSRREVPRDVLLAWEACTLGVAVRECRGRVPVHARAAVTLDRSHPAWHAEDGGRVGDVGVIAGPSREGPELTDDGKPFWIAARLPAALWTCRGGAPIAHRVIGDGTLAGMANRGHTLHMLVATEGTFSRLGTGACGACLTHAISVLTIDTSGKITEVLSDHLGESVGEDDGQGGTVEYSDVIVSAEKDLSRFGSPAGRRWERARTRSPSRSHRAGTPRRRDTLKKNERRGRRRRHTLASPVRQIEEHRRSGRAFGTSGSSCPGRSPRASPRRKRPRFRLRPSPHHLHSRHSPRAWRGICIRRS